MAPDAKSEAMFEELVAPVFEDEGGYVNNKFDRGGETNYGITADTLKSYQKLNGAFGPKDTLIGPKDLTRQQAKEIYRNEFFYGQRINEIKNRGIATEILDASVIHGPEQAWELLQRSLNSIDSSTTVVVDGVGGSSTIRKINALAPDDVRRLIDENDKYRREAIADFIKEKPNQKRFDRGWSNRLDKVKKIALSYAEMDNNP